MKALIIIDMFVRDVKDRSDKQTLIRNQLKLIKVFKDAKQKVILVGGSKFGNSRPVTNPVMLKLWGNEVSKNPEENKLIPELLSSNYDYCVEKSEYSAFYKTKLELICKKKKIEELYFAGVSSGCCVYFSAADAAMRKILPYLISDASGGPDLKTHKNNLAKFKDLLGPIISTSVVARRLKVA
jgi:isochorismate hydrolase